MGSDRTWTKYGIISLLVWTSVEADGGQHQSTNRPDPDQMVNSFAANIVIHGSPEKHLGVFSANIPGMDKLSLRPVKRYSVSPACQCGYYYPTLQRYRIVVQPRKFDPATTEILAELHAILLVSRSSFRGYTRWQPKRGLQSCNSSI